MVRRRVGVVLLVPAPEATEIDGLRRALGHRKLAAVAPHVTLVPPVNVSAAELPEAEEVLRAAAAAIRPIRLELGPVATFAPVTPVVYLQVRGDAVTGLRERVLAGPLARPVTHPFVPHVTLAEDVPPERIAAAVASLDGWRAAVTVDRLHLLEEQADRSWPSLASFPLGGPRVAGRGGLELRLDVADRLDAGAEAAFERAWQAHLDASYPGVPGPRPFAITARRGSEVVGVALGETDEELVLHRVVVAGHARGEGIGDRLLAEVVALGGQRGCGACLLVCQAGGPAAAWYAARGWSVVTDLPGWRHGRDFVRMRRPLAP